MIDAKLVKELREMTSAGMMDCKKALAEVDGNLEKAIEYLKEKGITKAAKKSSRIAAEGLVDVYVTEDNKIASVIEVNAETDFVAKNEEFKKFVKELAKLVALKDPKSIEELNNLEYEDGKTVKEVLTEKIATIGENMNIRRFERIETPSVVAGYLHGEGKIAVLVQLDGGTKEAAEDVAMQVAALNPEYLDETQIEESRLNSEKHIIMEHTLAEGKPAAIAEKIAAGRLQKVFEEICLVHQPFVKDGSLKVKEYVAKDGGKVVKFVRFEKGEGLEKRVENFAEEVMQQLK